MHLARSARLPLAAARQAGAAAAVGIVSDYQGVVFDDPAACECHSGTVNSDVWRRASVARSNACEERRVGTVARLRGETRVPAVAPKDEHQ